MIVEIFDGRRVVEARACQVITLADGRRAAIYRGLAFPLLASGESIDVSGEAISLAAAPGATPIRADAAPQPVFAVIGGSDGAYVLLCGSGLRTQEIATALRADGFAVARTGRYLGEPVDGVTADWFVRLVGASDTEVLRARLSALLSTAPAEVDAAQLRLRLLTDELTAARETTRRSAMEVERLQARLAAGADSSHEVVALREQLGAETRRRETAESNADAALARLREAEAETMPSGRSQPRLARNVSDEIGVVLSALLPRIRLLRDSLDTACVEFSDRSALYRVLSELQACEGAAPQRWKTVQGAEGWIEHSKVSNGTDSQGRVYARLDRSDRRWDVLVSHKSAQDRDIAWITRQ